MAAAAEDAMPPGEASCPDTLWNLCLEFCAANLSSLASQGDNNGWCLYDSVHLPIQICDSLLQTFHNRNMTINDNLMHLFHDSQRTRLQRVDLRGSEVTDRCIRWIMLHEPKYLNLMGCPNLTTASLFYINKHGKNLTTLTLGTYLGLFSDLDLSSDGESNSEEFQNLVQNGLSLPNIRALTLRNLLDMMFCVQDVVRWILPSMRRLTFLDLSGCDIDIGQLDVLEELQEITKLILYNVKVADLSRTVSIICKLTRLRALDLSQGGEHAVIYPEPERHLREIMRCLPNLRWLDIAGTNLAGFERNEHGDDENSSEIAHCSIPGLAGRHLDFLGLMMCSYNACNRRHIPATQVTGSADENQIILSIQTYQDKPNLLTKALNELFSLFRYVEVHRKDDALLAVTGAMKTNPLNHFIQTLGVACLVFMVKYASKHRSLGHKVKQQTVMAILTAMEMHQNLIMLMRRGCLALSYLDIPNDLLFCYGRVMKMLLYLVAHLSHDENLTQVALYLMKHLSSQVDIVYKENAGRLGAISAMLDVINEIVDSGGECDSAMLRAWSVLWSLTDMAPVNSEYFLDYQGMRTFLQCCSKYPGNDSLIRKMIGMMCNVSEVKKLRPRLMVKAYIEKFVELLDTELNISNSACGVLAHLVAESSESWQAIDNPNHEEVLEAISRAINSWDVETRRNVRYRSFEPMMCLFQCYHIPEAQHWAAWEVCNMTKKDPNRYCPMLEREGGMAVLQEVVQDPRPSDQVKYLVQEVINMWEIYKIAP